MPVQPLGVDRVERVLHRLQPVDRDQRASQHADRAFGNEAVPARQQRPRLRAEIGEQHAVELFDRIGRGLDLVLEADVLGLVGLVQAVARVAEFPAVIGTPDAVLGRDAVKQRRAAMRALFLDQAAAALTVAKQHQVLAEQAHAHRPAVRQFRGGGDRLPVAAEQIAGRGSRANPGQQVVLFGRQHRAVPPCASYELTRRSNGRSAPLSAPPDYIRHLTLFLK